MIINYDIESLKDPITENADWITMPNVREQMGIEQLQPLRKYWIAHRFSIEKLYEPERSFASPKG